MSRIGRSQPGPLRQRCCESRCLPVVLQKRRCCRCHCGAQESRQLTCADALDRKHGAPVQPRLGVQYTTAPKIDASAPTFANLCGVAGGHGDGWRKVRLQLRD